ncbi:LpxI family protein [Falsiroseomonas oryziterrae]|uniref:LpxI family protein n=1 Tax=Falsiroseomonas oryziterrae TaxID=2911368 RepID=UPI001F30E023|nr:UDP-2,3-diacylglucosamine diphosphatase LpxI [Roseomonas sp. NPKOSM-4]
MPGAPPGPAPLGLVAGGGLMPLRVADAAAKAGRPVVCVLLEGFAQPADYAAYRHSVLPLGQVGRMMALMREHGVRDLVLAGRVARPSLTSARFDAEGLRLAAKLGARALFGGDDTLLSAVLGLLRGEGFNPVGAQEILGDLLVPEGRLSAAAPSDDDRRDIARGIAVVRALGAVDVGQGCVVQQGLVLGVEAIEGTDALLARCAGLRRAGAGGVLVKLVKPRQDVRADLPVIGPDTVRNAAAAGLAGIAIEARSGHAGTLVVDRAETIAAADAAGLFLLAIRPDLFSTEESAA